MKQDILLDGSAKIILKNMEFKSLNMIKKLIKQKVIKFKKQKKK